MHILVLKKSYIGYGLPGGNCNQNLRVSHG